VLAAVEAAKALLDTGTTLFAGAQGAGIDMALLRDLHLMTAKPFLYVFNLDEEELGQRVVQGRASRARRARRGDLPRRQGRGRARRARRREKLELLRSIGQDESGLDLLAHVGFRTLGLQTYLTAGPKEARAWTIRRGATAPEAAGVIHTDFQRGFIKAEVVSYDDLVDAGSMAEAKSRGKVRIEGKDYVMADGDVVEFRFNV
jgi:ribosome-binding ATPase YchF (GTP1/OBG family)